MPRPYGDKLLRQLNNPEKITLGVELGRLCVQANLPAAYVAVALECSRMSVYSWFRGTGIREDHRKRVEAFMSLVETDLSEGVLPAKSVMDAKRYVESLIGVEL
jgi:hypothetical protein